ncbi:RNA polymerase sigma factor RpoD/SigA [bacterium]|nr:RNA polymerase sigma factor RpoD/SigA [bacterium]
MSRFREQGIDEYFASIHGFRLVTPDEERALALRIRKGDAAAREELINANLRLVISIATAYAGRGLSLLDLIEEGNLGLTKAAGLFNPDLGCRFATYATWWIKQAIRRALADTAKTVRIPSYLHPKIAEWKEIARKLEEAFGREPSLAEIAKAAGVAPRTFPIMASALLTLRSIRQTVSLDSGTDDDEPLAGGLEDRQGHDPSEEAASRQAKNRLAEILNDMPKRSLEILTLRFGLDGEEPQTLREVGQKVHLSRERVRQIEAESLAQLRRLFDPKGFPTG